ncbi:MAG: M23 family metallopeptidase [Spirochaetaceae bacterium]|jgi:murein DD-endopeptidase MepM/ murein hydrolase activator NlpD|nr:M23 family metallopeptidase [Spirochaetaceae bacterium]
MKVGWDNGKVYRNVVKTAELIAGYVCKYMPWYKTAVRWTMAAALAYYIIALGWAPLPAPGKGLNRTKSRETVPDSEQSMGGYSFESGAILKNASFDEEGLPLPAEFSKPELLLYTSYTIQNGDTISTMAQKFGLNQDTIISVNGITNTRTLRVGQELRIPNQDGILYRVQNSDVLASIAAKFETEKKSIQTANELFSDKISSGTSVFIPGAKLDLTELHEINGDLFAWPVRGRITSNYGYRVSPFTGQGRQFHSGMDIAVPMGTPIKAAMSGRVAIAGYDNTYGNYVVISHHSGYRTLYGHMKIIRTKAGAYVETGERIGDAGSTGLSTGPHLHFTVYKNGVTVNPRQLLK